MKHNDKKLNSTKIVLMGIAIALVVACVAASLIFQFESQDDNDANKSMNENVNKPSFVVDKAKTVGWWTGGNNWPNIKDYTGGQIKEDSLPIADITIHQCKDASNCEVSNDIKGGRCFVTISYYGDIVRSDEAVAEKLKKNNSFGDMTITEVNVSELEFATYEGNKTYSLHKYDYAQKNGGTIMRGNAIGYVPLRDGHVEVQGVCAEASQLDEIVPVLTGIKLNT